MRLGTRIALVLASAALLWGCAQQDQRVASSQRQQPPTAQQRKIQAQLAAATAELDASRKELTASITELARTRHAGNRGIRRLAQNDVRREMLDKALATAKADLAAGRKTEAQVKAQLAEHIKRLVRAAARQEALHTSARHSAVRASQPIASAAQVRALAQHVASLRQQVTSLMTELAASQTTVRGKPQPARKGV